MDTNRELKAFEWMSSQPCNSLHVSRNDHACNYVTAKVWIEEYHPEEFAETDTDEIQRMKNANTIWSVQIYPITPIGSYTVYGATLLGAIEQAMQLPLKV